MYKEQDRRLLIVRHFILILLKKNTILDEIDGEFRPSHPPPPPPPPPQKKKKKIKDGKMTRFRPFRWTSSLIWGDGGLLFHFILSKIVGFGSCKEVLLQFFYSLQIGGVSGFKMDKYHWPFLC